MTLDPERLDELDTLADQHSHLSRAADHVARARELVVELGPGYDTGLLDVAVDELRGLSVAVEGRFGELLP